MICPDLIYSKKFAFIGAKDACISISGILPSLDDLISLPEPRFDFGRFFTVKAVSVADYLIIAPFHVLAQLVVTVEAKCKQWVTKPARVVSRMFHSIPPSFKKVFTMRL